MAYPYGDELHARVMAAIDAGENMVLQMCRQQGKTGLLRRVIESLRDRKMDVAVVSTTRDHAREVVAGIELPDDGPLSVTVLSNHGPEYDMDGDLEAFDLVLMDNVYYMQEDVLDTITKWYKYIGITMTRIIGAPPPLHNLAHHVDARWCRDDGTIINDRVPPWINPGEVAEPPPHAFKHG